MERTKPFDVIVIGVGTMGSAATYYLARRGARVLGLEQFGIPHTMGSHAGQSRIIRKAYFEHPDYVPLLERAYLNWEELARTTKSEIFVKTGLLYFGKPEHPAMQGTLSSAQKFHIPIDILDHAKIKQAYPAIHLPGDYIGVWEPDAGFLTPERAVSLFTEQARLAGAQVMPHTKVMGWEDKGDGFSVETDQGVFCGKKLVISSGPWTSKLLPQLDSQLKVTRQALAWVEPLDPQRWALGKWPCWTLSEDGLPGIFYGFPVLPEERFGGPVGFKIAHHAPGNPTDPDHVSREPIPEDERVIRRVLDQYFPGMFGETRVIKTCLYTNTRDEHFLIDFLPGYEERIALAAGFSGHGFKFASVVGQILSDLCLGGITSLPIGFLGLNRLAI
jgi:sarcosine oxidase